MSVGCPLYCLIVFFFSSRRRRTRCSRDWSSDVCSSDLRDFFTKPTVHFNFPFAQLLKFPTTWSNALAAMHARERCQPLLCSQRRSALVQSRDNSTVPALAAGARPVGLPVTFAASRGPLRCAPGPRIPVPDCVLAASWLPPLDQTGGSACLTCETH